jgi:hypothetical protein
VIVSSELEAQQPARSAVPPALLALVAPDAGMEQQARIGTARMAFLIALVCAMLAALAQAYRVDSREATLKKLQMTGQMQSMSDRQFEDETKSANRLYQVSRVGAGVVEAPLFLGLGSLGIVILVWFLRGKLKGRAVVPVAAAALLPGALANLLDAVSAWNHASLPPQGAELAPRTVSALAAVFGQAIPPPWVKLGNAFDFFSLWAAVLMGFGVAAAGEIPVRRAIITTLAAWVCLRLLTQVASGGQP